MAPLPARPQRVPNKSAGKSGLEGLHMLQLARKRFPNIPHHTAHLSCPLGRNRDQIGRRVVGGTRFATVTSSAA
jgi:hypothetical protein